MRQLAYAAAFAAVFGLASYSVAQTKPDTKPDHEPGMTKAEPIHVYGTIVKLFKDEKGEKMSGKLTPPREGEIIFLHVSDAQFRDLREKKGWFGGKKDEGMVGVDKGWKYLDEGYRLRAECNGTHEMVAPKDFPKEARVGGNIIVYHVTSIEVLGEHGSDKK